VHLFKPLEKQLRDFVWPSQAALSAWPAGVSEDEGFLAKLSPEQQSRFVRITDVGRRALWISARKAELEVARELAGRGVAPAELLTSTSHSGEWALAIAVSRRTGLLGVGIDLEEEARAVRPRLEVKIVSEEEQALGLEPLEHWVLKEACFKADPENSGRVLSQYRLISREEAVGPGTSRFRVQLAREAGFLVGLAMSFSTHFED
jgi:4'-phosphopantetheinyl transferase EntD